ncbi:MAG: hypothetical protein HQL24_05285 [Candidatus Omnitrophica bacterium]|nr:hypothetical protein [Candidatus Omnitrophota bacterium]
MNILYLAAGSQKWGMGHLKRSKFVIDCLRVEKQKVTAIAIIPDDRNIGLSKAISGYDHFVTGLASIKNKIFDGVIVDVHTDFQPEVFKWLKKQNRPTVGLDWYSKTDGVITQTVNLRGGAKVLKFALIRKEILKQTVQKKRTFDAVAVLGGKDSRGYLDKLLKIFVEDDFYKNKKIIFVVGPMVKGKISEFVGHKKGPVTILRNPERLPEIMAKTKVGLTNGGTSLMEFTRLGVPTIVFPQSKQEENFIPVFLRQGGSLRGSMNPRHLQQQLLNLWEDERLWEKKSQKAKQLIDGRGVKRTVQKILKVFRK